MRALVVYCHPEEGSFTAAVRDTVLERLAACGVETRLCDLYAEGFQPVLTGAQWRGYHDAPNNRTPVEAQVRDLQWCDTLIFIYPTWWHGLPAMLKGWLDRVLLPGVAFTVPKMRGDAIQPGLHHIENMGVFTTYGASWWVVHMIGAPGRRTLLRGVGVLLKPRARKVFAAAYLVDSASPKALAKHLGTVARGVDQLVGPTAPRRGTRRGRV